ncbi:DUF58 domain-containing protein [Actinomyces vulturis]|uniref:DUF58 domain-containing protein n=1 Tax=Actinomyces vulturis TaxID=1857645 RepID=UPI00083491CE|nr:DUF58 domain-containing protein [Actinomyces vulturis]
MFITRRTVFVTALSVPLAIVVPSPWWLAGWVGFLIGFICVLDMFLSPKPDVLHIERRVPGTIRLGQSVDVEIDVLNTASRPVHAHLKDAWPPSAGAENKTMSLFLEKQGHVTLTHTLIPTRRGDRQAAPLTLRVLGPLGFAGRQWNRDIPCTVRVLPPFHSRRHLPSRLVQLREIEGRAAVMMHGQGTEFDSLRPYVIGDDVRSIDWRSTARRGEVVLRTWRPERDRRVLVIVDTARLSAVRLGDEPRLDSFIESALLLAALASHAGDHVDVVGCDREVRARTHGVAGDDLLHHIASEFAPVDARLIEMDWSLVWSLAQRSLTHHGLIVVLTTIESATLDSRMRKIIGTLAQQHTVVVAHAQDPALDEAIRHRDDPKDTYVAAAAEHMRSDVYQAASVLTQLGVSVVQASPTALPPAVADRYLELKAAGKL